MRWKKVLRLSSFSVVCPKQQWRWKTTKKSFGEHVFVRLVASSASLWRPEEQREDKNNHSMRCWSCDLPYPEEEEEEEEEEADVSRENDSVLKKEATKRQFFCLGCDAVSHPARVSRRTHFQTLRCPTRFAVDVKRLEKAMRSAQSVLHPDKFATKSEHERGYAEEMSARVNEAYGRLREPLARAKYLFKLRTRETSTLDDEEEENEGGGMEAPSELLFLVMEVREAIEEAANERNREALAKMKEENDERIQVSMEKVRQALDEEEDAMDAAKEAIVELKYYERIRKEILEHL